MPHRLLGWLLTLTLIAGASEAADCTALTHRKFGHAVVTDAQMVAAGTPVEDQLPPARSDFCRIRVLSRPTEDSAIHIELWVPANTGWNGKYEQVGNGGYAGSVPYSLMALFLSSGYAVAGTDDGHQSAEATDASWALNHPERIKDFGYRAIDETARAAKRILHELTQKAPEKSYFFGCSDGGREALMMAQRFPSYFDGIVAGAPAYSMVQLFTGGALRTVALGGVPAYLPPPQLALIQSLTLKTCGDGGSYLKDPRSCRPNLRTLKCAAGAETVCLTEAQIKTAETLYADRKDPANGDTLFGVLPGAEAVRGSWDASLTGMDEHTQGAASAYTWNYVAYWLMQDPKVDVAKISEADLIRGEREFAPIIDATSADLSAFKARGGKLIQYHGWNDPLIAPGFSLDYRQRLKATTAGLSDFYRLYMVPGMLHCGGGDAPTMVNWQAALVAWVEKSTPPDELIAGDGKGATQTLHPFE